MKRSVRAPDTAQFYVERFLSQGGLTRDDVNFVTPSQLPEVLAAFAIRSIAAAWLPEPFVTQGEKQGLAMTVATTGKLFVEQGCLAGGASMITSV